METRRKLCRCVACPRYIDDAALFCNVHLAQLTPRILSPIADNREPVADADAARVLAGTAEAVAFIARKEGRASALADAQRTNEPTPGQGGAPSTEGGGGRGRGFETERLREL